jgi:hypothetical protein
MQVALQQKHLFKEYTVLPFDLHPEGGTLFRCPYCGYEYYQWNDEQE